MRNRIFVTTAIFCLAFGFGLRAQQPATVGKVDAETAHIQKLIENLGSVSFEEREQASKDLEHFGTPAISELRKAIANDDAEISCRATRLLGRLEEKALVDSLLAAKRIRLSVKDVTVAQAVTELENLCKPYKIEVIGDRTPLSTRKITLDTGEVTFWEALQQLCQKGNLVEQITVPRPNNQPFNNRFPPPPQNQPVQTIRTVVLQDGAFHEMPVSFAGSVRIRALTPAGPLPQGETQIQLDVAGEQRLQNFGVIGSLIFDKAIDDQGQFLTLAADQQVMNPQINNFNGNRIMIVNGQIVPFGGTSLNQQRTISFRFHKGPKAARTLKELSGKLIVQALGNPEPLVTVKNFRKSLGQTVQGKDGNSLQVQTVDSIDNGAIRMNITVEATPEPTNLGQVPWNGGNVGVMVLNGNFQGMINGVQFINGVPITNVPTNFPKLVDIKGKTYDAEINTQKPEVVNGRVVRQATLTYRPQAAADQLVLIGQRTILFSVPVALKNVPLQ